MMDTMNFPMTLRDVTMPESRHVASAESVMDEEEFRLFYERTARPLWSYLSRISGDRQRADDLLQEAYYRFYRARARHESEAHRRNSLFQIATNLVRDAARRARTHEDVPLLDDDAASAQVLVSQSPVPERQAEIRTDLARAMKQLDPMHRELLWLAYAQGASHDEIAGIVGIRAVSVRTTLHRARKKLAAILNQRPAGGTKEARP